MSPLIYNGVPSSVPSSVSEGSTNPKSLTPRKGDLLIELASSISTNAQIMSIFLYSEGHNVPSFDHDAASTVVTANAPTDVKVAREALLESSMKMFQLASGPREYLPNLAVHVSCPFSPILWQGDPFCLFCRFPGPSPTKHVQIVPISVVSPLVDSFRYLFKGSSHRINHLCLAGGGCRHP